MKENYLHYLWYHKLIPFQKLSLNGEAIQVIDTGEYNRNESGPDFISSKVKIGSLIWAGNVEMHVRSSDWFRHRHHLDRSYDSVILHVVYIHDIEVVQHGRLLPVIELQNFIDLLHFQKYCNVPRPTPKILCRSVFKGIDNSTINHMFQKALYQRLDRKTDKLNVWKNDPQQVLYFLFGSSFGSKVNSLPFEQLVLMYPISNIKKLEKKEQQNIILSAVELMLNGTDNENIVGKSITPLHNKSTSYSWKQKGLRPASFPRKRVVQFALFVAEYNFDLSFTALRGIKLLEYFESVLTFKKYNNQIELYDPSRFLKNNIIINAFLPFVFWYGKQTKNNEMISTSLELYSKIQVEENRIVKDWNQQMNTLFHAGESQAVLEIYSQYCSKKKCLSCDFGNKIVGR